MRQSIEKLLRALPPGCHYEIEQSDIGRPLCNYDDPAPTCEGPVQEHDVGRRCYIIGGELRIESNREKAARVTRESAARAVWFAKNRPRYGLTLSQHMV
jgi:hypothetical protein